MAKILRKTRECSYWIKPAFLTVIVVAIGTRIVELGDGNMGCQGS